MGDTLFGGAEELVNGLDNRWDGLKKEDGGFDSIVNGELVHDRFAAR